MERARELEDLTRQLYESLGRADSAGVADRFTRREGVLVIGTDPQEWWTGHETIRKIWEAQLGEIDSIGVEDADPQAYASGDVGWFADRPTLVLGGDMRIALRVTGVYARENGEWKLAQWHASIGVPNEESFGEGITTTVDATS